MSSRNLLIALLSIVVALIAVSAVVLSILAYGRVTTEQAAQKASQGQLQDVVVALAATQGQLRGIVATLARDSSNQLANRVSNVATWCSAINAGRDYSRFRVRTITHTARYTLPDLNCLALEKQTASSAK